MIDKGGKLFGKIQKLRLLTAVHNVGALSKRQNGFQKGRSPVDAPLNPDVLSVGGVRISTVYAFKAV